MIAHLSYLQRLGMGLVICCLGLATLARGQTAVKPPATRQAYPWESNVVTTFCWRGMPGTMIQPLDNAENPGKEVDSPTERNGYAPGDHAPLFSPFYVALPFSDLKANAQARALIPASWLRTATGGTPVSACKDHWVEIKNASGRVCYAQWKLAGPWHFNHGEFVFGKKPFDAQPGLAISPAIGQYFGFDPSTSDKIVTSWRFVDDAEVPPGSWLKYDELAVVYRALHASTSPGALISAPAQLDATYFGVFKKLNEAQQDKNRKDYQGSLEVFQDCQAQLQKVRESNPYWESALVVHRLWDLKAQIADLQKTLAGAKSST